MIVRTFLLTRRAVRLWITAFHYTPNVSVFFLFFLFFFSAPNGRIGIVFPQQMAGLWLHTGVHLGTRIIYSSAMSSHFGAQVFYPKCDELSLSLLSFHHFLSSVPLPSFSLCLFSWSLLLLYPSSICSLCYSFFFPQYHRDLEMSLSLSASQVQAVMLAE